MTTAAPQPIRLGDVTIHRIIEQEAPLFGAAEFFPTLTEEMLAPHRHWLEPKYLTGGKLVLCIQSYLVETPTHTILVDTCVGNHKERPKRPFWHRMSSDRYERNLAAAGFSVSRHRLRHVHPPARRPRRLEYQARERPLGADVPQCEIPVLRHRARSLHREERSGRRRLSLDHRFGAADRRREPRRVGGERPSARRCRAPATDAGPHHRSLLGRGRTARCRCDHHRRRDSLADPRLISPRR